MYRWILLSFLLLSSGCVNVPPSLFGPQRGKPQVETLREGKGRKRHQQILVIDLEGEVTGGGSDAGLRSSTGMLVTLKDKLKAAEGNKQIKALILRINSPGGGVTPSDLIHQELLAFKEKQQIPVIAHLGDIAASGGVYMAMAADEVYALPTTITGSIGVIAVWPGLQELSEKVGIDMRVFTSADKKDIGSPWRDMTEEEQALIQSMIDGMYERFLSIILDSRKEQGLSREALLTFADGRVFSASEAKDYGLIDGVAYVDEVIQRAMELGDCEGAAVVSYEYPYAYRGNIHANSPVQSPKALFGETEISLLPIGDLDSSLEAGFHYRWIR